MWTAIYISNLGRGRPSFYVSRPLQLPDELNMVVVTSAACISMYFDHMLNDNPTILWCRAEVSLEHQLLSESSDHNGRTAQAAGKSWTESPSLAVAIRT